MKPTQKHTLPSLILLRYFGGPSAVLRRILILAFLAMSTLAAHAQNSDEAKSILRLSREKCQSIRQGH